MDKPGSGETQKHQQSAIDKDHRVAIDLADVLTNTTAADGHQEIDRRPGRHLETGRPIGRQRNA